MVNPVADDLTFTADRTRTRRDHEKYLTLIDAIALLHQYQRPTEKTTDGGSRSSACTLDDIALANRLAPELLGRSPRRVAAADAPSATRRSRPSCASGATREKIEQRLAFLAAASPARGWAGA